MIVSFSQKAFILHVEGSPTRRFLIASGICPLFVAFVLTLPTDKTL